MPPDHQPSHSHDHGHDHSHSTFPSSVQGTRPLRIGIGGPVGSGKTASRWRLTKLDDLLLYAGTATKVQAWVARDKRLLELPLAMPRGMTTWRLLPGDKAPLGRWLNSP